MPTATKARPVSAEGQQAYQELVDTLASDGGAIDVTAHANILARSGRDGSQLLADVADARHALRQQAAKALESAEGQLAAGGPVSQADAAAMRELNELESLEKSCRDKLEAKRAAWLASRDKADTLQRRVVELKRRAEATLIRSADRSLQEQIDALQQELARVRAEIAGDEYRTGAYDQFRRAKEPPSQAVRAANLERQAELQRQINEAEAAKFDPEAIAV